MTHSITRTNLTLLAISLAVVLSLIISSFASANHFWQVQLSQPFSASGGLTNQTSFNLEYKVQSTDNTPIEVTLTQNGTNLVNQTVNNGGDSYAVPVTLSNGNGDYVFELSAESESKTRDYSATVTLDRSSPPAPDFDGAVRTDDGYRLNYRVFGADVSEVVFYSSTSSSFTADNTTVLARQSVSAGQRSFSYDTTQRRFHALRVIDNAGNVSPLVGDPGATVTVGSAPALTTANTGSSTTAASSNNSGEAAVQGDTDTTDDGDVTTDDQNQSTDDNAASDDADGDVEQAADEADDDSNAAVWWVVGLLVAAGAWFSYRRWLSNQ